MMPVRNVYGYLINLFDYDTGYGSVSTSLMANVAYFDYGSTNINDRGFNNDYLGRRMLCIK